MRSRAWSLWLVVALTLLAPAPAAARTYGCQADANCTDDAATGCTIFQSRADGVADYYYYRLPDAYDPTRAYPLLLWFHAMGQANTSPSPNDDCIISAQNLMVEMANGGSSGLGAKDVIILGLAQRGPQDFLGDFCQQDCPTPAPDDAAAKADMLELINQLVARFRVSYVITAGSSMGGYVALRLAQLDPAKVHVVFGSAPALHRGRETTADPGENGPGSSAIEAAFQAGLYDDKVVFDLIGLADENQIDIVLSNQALNTLMTGRPYWQFAEEQGVPHVNHFSDDYLCLSSGGYRSPDSKWPPLCDDTTGRKPFLQNVAYGCQHPQDATCGFSSDPFTTGRLWDAVRVWEIDHPALATGELWPTAGWQVPDADGWYLEQALYAQGGKTPAAGADGGVAPTDGGAGPAPNADGAPPPRADAGGGGGGGGDGCAAAGGGGSWAGLALLAWAWRRRRARARSS